MRAIRRAGSSIVWKAADVINIVESGDGRRFRCKKFVTEDE